MKEIEEVDLTQLEKLVMLSQTVSASNSLDKDMQEAGNGDPIAKASSILKEEKTQKPSERQQL